jgi:hypothetical protein
MATQLRPLPWQRNEKAVLEVLELYDGVPLSAGDVAEEAGLGITTASHVLCDLYRRYIAQRDVRYGSSTAPHYHYWLGLPRLWEENMPKKSPLTKHHQHIERLYLAGISQDVIASLLGSTQTTINGYIQRARLFEAKERYQASIVNLVAAQMRAGRLTLARTEGKGEREWVTQNEIWEAKRKRQS